MNHRLTFPALLLLALGACDDASAESAARIDGRALPLAVDVAENMARFVFDDAPLHEDGLPAYGNQFITEGYLYPEGYLDENPGVRPDGSPAAPDLVIGNWTCRGAFVGDGAHTSSGPMVITSQYIEFYEQPGHAPGKKTGARSLITEGYESMETGVAVPRAITGGTGAHQFERGGEVVQEFLGLNSSEGVNIRIRFRDRPAR